MESIGDIMSKDFEEFLRYRWCEGNIKKTEFKKWSPEKKQYVGELDLAQELKDAGIKEDTADDLAAIIWSAIGDVQEDAYIQGVEDGAQLELHLLGMAPKTKRDAS
jgi:hypothetical protein